MERMKTKQKCKNCKYYMPQDKWDGNCNNKENPDWADTVYQASYGEDCIYYKPDTLDSLGGE